MRILKTVQFSCKKNKNMSNDERVASDCCRTLFIYSDEELRGIELQMSATVLETEATATAGPEPQPFPRINTDWWCSSGNSTPMLTNEECLCSREFEYMTTILTDMEELIDDDV